MPQPFTRSFTPKNLTLGLACLTLTACMTPEETAPVSGPTFLTQQEIQATLPGATVNGIFSSDNTTRYQKTFNADGTTSGLINGSPFSAAWSIDGNRWCEQWDTGSDCWLISQEGPNQLRAYQSETDPFRNPFFIQ